MFIFSERETTSEMRRANSEVRLPISAPIYEIGSHHFCLYNKKKFNKQNQQILCTFSRTEMVWQKKESPKSEETGESQNHI